MIQITSCSCCGASESKIRFTFIAVILQFQGHTTNNFCKLGSATVDDQMYSRKCLRMKFMLQQLHNRTSKLMLIHTTSVSKLFLRCARLLAVYKAFDVVN